MKIEISGVTFTQGGLIIQWIDLETDVRVKGYVVHQHQVTLDAEHPDYRADIQGLHDKAVRVLRNALEDFEESEPERPDLGPTEEQVELGMGHG